MSNIFTEIVASLSKYTVRCSDSIRKRKREREKEKEREREREREKEKEREYIRVYEQRHKETLPTQPTSNPN